MTLDGDVYTIVGGSRSRLEPQIAAFRDAVFPRLRAKGLR